MKHITIAGIADTHGLHEKIKPPKADILVVAGDFCNRGTIEEVVAFNAWLRGLDYAHIVVTPGNHDLVCERNRPLMKQLFTAATYLEGESTECMGIKFYGMAFTPEFGQWGFMYPANSPQAAHIWASVPEDTQVLISHGPPAGCSLGRTKATRYARSEDAGCVVHRRRISELPKLQAAFCGHLHEGAGIERVCGVNYFNVSVLDEQYHPYAKHGKTYRTAV